ncbi:hypothetical protein SAMN02745227_00282 [Anaerobranca californiensis DSM 14826]|jgi:hypothetical protein|uniref:Uncharacterized protein n=1 Tax=Anaerobranca californiensis DSM 14826 TaxID=1120989 RepID=A0A1M6KWX8_9FIRM|nr:hypothetical protein [Anaerobranca californiensis]SHJ63463.1 hypothetical protein SAMN02745227_00282 [Anaerobranca californiensis DSM 14826]
MGPFKRNLNRFKNKFKEMGYYNYNYTEFGELFDFDYLFLNKVKRATHCHQRSFFKPSIKNHPDDY